MTFSSDKLCLQNLVSHYVSNAFSECLFWDCAGLGPNQFGLSMDEPILAVKLGPDNHSTVRVPCHLGIEAGLLATSFGFNSFQ